MTHQNPRTRDLFAHLSERGPVTAERVRRVLDMAARVDCILEATYALKTEVVR